MFTELQTGVRIASVNAGFASETGKQTQYPKMHFNSTQRHVGSGSETSEFVAFQADNNL